MTLNADGWRRVESLFHAAADLTEDAREALLASELEQSREVVESVRRLLAADRGSHTLLDTDASAMAAALLEQPRRTVLPESGP
jgi:hypothetical protein